MSSSNPVIIFHRSKHNSEEDLANQQDFLKANQKTLGSAHVIDYMTGNDQGVREVFEVFRNIDSSNKVIVIMNSSLTKKDYDLRYDLNFYFRSFQTIGLASIYLMDSDGRLYKEIETIERL